MTRDDRRKAYRSGLIAEAVSACLLTLKGYRILARRYKTPVGEIDLVAKRGTNLVFVEVKVRSTTETLAEAISSRQQERIRRAASAYLAQNPWLSGLTCRFDAILCVPWRLWRHVPNAWQ